MFFYNCPVFIYIRLLLVTMWNKPHCHREGIAWGESTSVTHRAPHCIVALCFCLIGTLRTPQATKPILRCAHSLLLVISKVQEECQKRCSLRCKEHT